jgi:hypothetical protein
MQINKDHKDPAIWGESAMGYEFHGLRLRLTVDG